MYSNRKLSKKSRSRKINCLTNHKLKKLYRKAEFDREHDEVKEIETRIRSFVHEISEYIGCKDPLFKNFVIPSGSYYENLKVEGPDEFDFMMCLKALSKPGVCVSKDIPSRDVSDPGYVDVKIIDKASRRRWKDYIYRRKILQADLLLERFQNLIKEAVSRRKRLSQDKIAELVEIELRKIPVTVKVIWNGTKYSNYEISMDLTLCIEMSGWPAASNICQRVDINEHPRYDLFQEAVRAGHHLVASTIGESGKHGPCWRLSFSIPEGIVLNGIFKNAQSASNAALKALKVLRKKLENYLCLFEDDSELDLNTLSISYNRITWAFHSYVLKTMFLYEWTQFPYDSDWTMDKLGIRMKGILQRIRDSVVRKDIRSFWIPDYKLFNFQARKDTQTAFCVNNLSSLLEQFS
ncbi:cyclic GMP-AMP synthase-like receptor [Montipora foliosa]|uniref:cyclic GMP-AMP synthase-like receptor n=1 Tax=Montipora foliosa TaxID=591990 RepID=UPI0035F176CD